MFQCECVRERLVTECVWDWLGSRFLCVHVILSSHFVVVKLRGLVNIKVYVYFVSPVTA